MTRLAPALRDDAGKLIRAYVDPETRQEARQLDSVCERYDPPIKPGDNSEAAYDTAFHLMGRPIVTATLKPGVYARGVSYLKEAQTRGEPVPDYIFATEEGTLWLEWCDGERRVVEIDNPSYAWIAGVFLVVVAGMAVVALMLGGG